MTNTSLPHTVSIDFGPITFPSDGLTFGDLRSRFRDKFDGAYAGGFGQFFMPSFPLLHEDECQHLLDLASMISAEREVAQMEYDRARGAVIESGWADDFRRACDDLAEHYRRFGVPKGNQSAELLVERVRQAARDLVADESGHS